MRKFVEIVLGATSLALSIAFIGSAAINWHQWSVNSAQHDRIAVLEKNQKQYEDFVAVVKERCDCDSKSHGSVHGSASGSVGAVGAAK